MRAQGQTVPSRRALPPYPLPLKISLPSKVTASARNYPFSPPHHRLPNAPTPPNRLFLRTGPALRASNQTRSRPGRLTPPARPLPAAAPPPSDNGAALRATSISCLTTLTSPWPRPSLPPQSSSPLLSFSKQAHGPSRPVLSCTHYSGFMLDMSLQLPPPPPPPLLLQPPP